MKTAEKPRRFNHGSMDFASFRPWQRPESHFGIDPSSDSTAENDEE
jgi:hypothetical protein